VLAATNRDLKSAVNAGTFRQDLFYRLNVFPIHLPSLSERVDDIPLLVEYFVDRYAQKAGKKFKDITSKTLALFQRYLWPGNIRELQNVIERAVILCDNETFSIDETWLKLDFLRDFARLHWCHVRFREIFFTCKSGGRSGHQDAQRDAL
jgi:formate hydrogenlyase transcriptional activator